MRIIVQFIPASIFSIFMIACSRPCDELTGRLEIQNTSQVSCYVSVDNLISVEVKPGKKELLQLPGGKHEVRMQPGWMCFPVDAVMERVEVAPCETGIIVFDEQ